MQDETVTALLAYSRKLELELAETRCKRVLTQLCAVLKQQHFRQLHCALLRWRSTQPQSHCIINLLLEGSRWTVGTTFAVFFARFSPPPSRITLSDRNLADFGDTMTLAEVSSSIHSEISASSSTKHRTIEVNLLFPAQPTMRDPLLTAPARRHSPTESVTLPFGHKARQKTRACDLHCALFAKYGAPIVNIVAKPTGTTGDSPISVFTSKNLLSSLEMLKFGDMMSVSITFHQSSVDASKKAAASQVRGTERRGDEANHASTAAANPDDPHVVYMDMVLTEAQVKATTVSLVRVVHARCRNSSVDPAALDYAGH